MGQRSELRKHYYLDDVVLIAPKRAEKPNSYKNSQKLVEHHAITCAFCNNEESIRFMVSDENGWNIKVIKNIYPAITEDNPFAYGVQEIVIDTPEHDLLFGDFSVIQTHTLLKVYQNRILTLKKQSKIKYVCIFKNDGPRAAASIPHCHSQIYGIPIVPNKIKHEQKVLKEYKEKHGNCAICDLINAEVSNKIRVVGQTDNVLALAPYASKSPYELWILPKKHTSHFYNLNDSVLYDIAEILNIGAKFLNSNNIDYNLVLNNLVDNSGHTYLQILPRPSTWGGFELDTDIIVNPVSPELAASQYRTYFKDKLKQPLHFATVK